MTGPRSLDELLAAVPGLRRCRSINADWLRRLLDREKGQCTWCGASVPKGKRTWCSDACVEAFRMRCDPAAQAAFVCRRDADQCTLCRRAIKELEAEYKAAWKAYCEARGASPYGNAYTFPTWRDEAAFRKRAGLGSNWREVDHVVPVIEGGGLTGPENLRLLCGVCHGKETARLRKRLSKKHKGPK